jgi:hypothetical protein
LIRFRACGKLLVRVREFDTWIKLYREGQDLRSMQKEVFGGS